MKTSTFFQINKTYNSIFLIKYDKMNTKKKSNHHSGEKDLAVDSAIHLSIL